MDGNGESDQPKNPKQKLVLKWEKGKDFLMDAMANFQRRGILTDVVLCCRDKRFSCHRMVLAAQSDYFAELFVSQKPRTGSSVKVVNLNFSPKCMQKLIEFMYTGECAVEEKEVVQVVRLSETLRLKGIIETGHDAQQSASKTQLRSDTEFDQLSVRSQESDVSQNSSSSCSSTESCPNASKKDGKYKKYAHGQMAKCLKAIQRGMTIRAAAKKFGIPERTLYSRRRRGNMALI